MAYRGALALGRYTRPFRGLIDGFDDLIGGEVMDHVAQTRKRDERALGYLLLQPL